MCLYSCPNFFPKKKNKVTCALLCFFFLLFSFDKPWMPNLFWGRLQNEKTTKITVSIFSISDSYLHLKFPSQALKHHMYGLEHKIQTMKDQLVWNFFFLYFLFCIFHFLLPCRKFLWFITYKCGNVLCRNKWRQVQKQREITFFKKTMLSSQTTKVMTTLMYVLICFWWFVYILIENSCNILFW